MRDLARTTQGQWRGTWTQLLRMKTERGGLRRARGLRSDARAPLPGVGVGRAGPLPTRLGRVDRQLREWTGPGEQVPDPGGEAKGAAYGQEQHGVCRDHRCLTFAVC